MGQMRPFQIIVLSVFGLLALVGLVLFATYKGMRGGSSVGPVTMWGTLPEPEVTRQLNNIRQTNRDFVKVTYVQRDEDNFDIDVANAIASGNGPDIIIANEEHLLAERNKLTLIPFKTIPERTFRDSYASPAYIYLTASGSYGIPLAVDPLVLYYNRSLLSRAGYANPPATWEEVLGATPTLTEKSGVSVSKSAIALGTYNNIENARAIISLLLLQSGSTITSSSANRGLESTLNTSSSENTGVSPAQSALAFYTQFADPAKMVYTWNQSFPSAKANFLAGDSAMYVGFASEYNYLKSANPNLDFDMARIPMPSTTNVPADYAHVYALAIPKSTKNMTGAYSVASTLALEASAEPLAYSVGMAPALRSSLGKRTDSPNAAVYNPLVLISKTWLSPSPSVTDRIFADMINGIINGSKNVAQALGNANDALSAALGQY